MNSHGGTREGAGRPRTFGERPTRQISLELPVDLIDALDRLCGDAGVSRAQWVARSIALENAEQRLAEYRAEQ